MGSIPEVTSVISPLCTIILGLVSTPVHPPPDLYSAEEAQSVRSLRAMIQEGAELPL